MDATSLTLSVPCDYPPRVLRRCLGFVALVLLGGAPGAAAGQTVPATPAARHFESGQALFSQGRYVEAIDQFSEANRLAPHPSALFNIARCHESLGHVDRALELYGRALQGTTERAGREDIERRMAQLRSLPVKVFVSSNPSGATVAVDSQKTPLSDRTPLVVQLKPGAHLLLLQLKDHQLTAQRVEVVAGEEQAVEVKLERLPAPCPPSPPPCPKPTPCPELRLTDADNLHLHVSVLGAFGLTTGRPFAGGTGLLVHATFRRWAFGAQFQYFPMSEGPVPGSATYSEARPRWIVMQIEGGRVFAFRSFYLYSTLGLGLAADRITFVGKYQGNTDSVREVVAFVWSVGGGIEAMATSWLSLGAGLRIGMGIGDRLDNENAAQDPTRQAFPFGLLLATATFHL
jgi:hypothetical protein